MEKDDQKDFRATMKKLNFDDLLKFGETMFGGYCGNANGDCLEKFQGIAMNFAAMMDRSCDPESGNYKCDNFRRLSGGIYDFIEFLSVKEEDLTIKMIVREFYNKVPRNFWCKSKKCASGFLSDKFNNNCCFRNAVGNFDEKTIQQLQRFIASIVRASGAKMPKIDNSIRKKIAQSFNPNRTCPKKYKEAMKSCDAVQYYLL